MRVLQVFCSAAVVIALVFSVSCGPGLDTPKTSAGCQETLTFDRDISSIVAGSGSGKCGNCHAGKYDMLAGIRVDRGEVFRQINERKMPTNDDAFRDSVDGQKILSWISCVKLK
jgi:hypothetical protein